MSCKIRSWKVSYFHNETNRWVYGLLTCSPSAVSFCQDHGGQPDRDKQPEGDHTRSTQASPDLVIEYTDIKQVLKAKSMLFFPALKVETYGGACHWFSSLPDRHSVYNALDYFTRHNLLYSKDAKEVKVDPHARTHIGQRLLKSAIDSERTLGAAAADLHGQGRQLDNASIHLQEIHEDLDVADHLLSGLNTYLGRWRLPEEYVHEEPVHISKDDVPSDQDLEVLCSELSKEQLQPQQLCMLRATDSGITLMTSRQRLLHTLRWVELSRVFVVSPWEVVLTKHVAGRVDVSVSVVSAALLPVLRLLERRVSHLMDYQTPPPPEGTVGRGERVNANTRGVSSPTEAQAFGHSKSRDRLTPSGLRESQLDTPGHQLKQGRQQEEGVSEAEMLALRSKLGGLKLMACAVEEELISQNKSLDDMIYSVDHADSRVCGATQRTKRLM